MSFDAAVLQFAMEKMFAGARVGPLTAFFTQNGVDIPYTTHGYAFLWNAESNVTAEKVVKHWLTFYKPQGASLDAQQVWPAMQGSYLETHLVWRRLPTLSLLDDGRVYADCRFAVTTEGLA